MASTAEALMQPSPVGVHSTHKKIARHVVGPGRGHAHKCSPKKGGGGRGGWGKPGDELQDIDQAPEPADESDRPYDLKDISNTLTKEDIEVYLTPRMEEFYNTGLSTEFAAACEPIPVAERVAVAAFVIRLGLDQNENERELSSQLVSDLYGFKVLSSNDIERAFEQLVADLADLKLDTPDAAEVLGKFMARCVADDCVPPIFVNSRAGPGESDASIAFNKAHTLITMPHGMHYLDSIWGQSGARRPVKFVIRQFYQILEEYLSALDVSEVERCLHVLGVPHFHHELVYEAVVMAIGKDPKSNAQMLICELLLALHKSNVVTPNQMEQGFLRLFADIEDIALDIPNAMSLVDVFVQMCVSKGGLSRSVADQSPHSQGRKRYLSENDGGKIKE